MKCCVLQFLLVFLDSSASHGDNSASESVKKKRVSWATDDNLTTVFYFQLDESERGMPLLYSAFLHEQRLLHMSLCIHTCIYTHAHTYTHMYTHRHTYVV